MDGLRFGEGLLGDAPSDLGGLGPRGIDEALQHLL